MPRAVSYGIVPPSRLEAGSRERQFTETDAFAVSSTLAELVEALGWVS